LASGGTEFFGNIRVDEIIVNDIQFRTLGFNRLEFDDEGIEAMKFLMRHRTLFGSRCGRDKGTAANFV
jgi:hypothetical protein